MQAECMPRLNFAYSNYCIFFEGSASQAFQINAKI